MSTVLSFVSNLTFDQLASSHLLRDLRLARPHFYWHPLYRRWSHQAHQTRLAAFSEALPDYLLNVLPTAFFAFPVVVLMIGMVFGMSTFRAVMIVTWILFLVLAVFSAGLGMMAGGGLAAYGLAREQEAGNWEVLMMLPQDRMGLLMMRVSATLFPYHPLITTLEVLQTASGFLAAIILNAKLDSPERDLLGACFVYLIPALAVMTWERRQDHALTVALGIFVGLSRKPQSALGWALGGGALLLALRLMTGLLAFGFSPIASMDGVGLPTLIAGVAILPVVAVSLKVAVPTMLVYYLLREALIFYFWRKIQDKMRGWD